MVNNEARTFSFVTDGNWKFVRGSHFCRLFILIYLQAMHKLFFLLIKFKYSVLSYILISELFVFNIK